MAERAAALAFYRQFVPDGGLCFDVGANVGERSDLFLDLGARVVAVEPQEECVAALRTRFGDAVTVVPAALGPEEGEDNLLVASYNTLSSLSPTWIDKVQASGRFAEFSWTRGARVNVTTLDALIEQVGAVPDFCKIDVEGYELQVLKGLSRALPALSYEFDWELLEERLVAVELLAALGMDRFNFSVGESLELALPEWVGAPEIRAYLTGLPKDSDIFGDVYAREGASGPSS